MSEQAAPAAPAPDSAPAPSAPQPTMAEILGEAPAAAPQAAEAPAATPDAVVKPPEKKPEERKLEGKHLAAIIRKEKELSKKGQDLEKREAELRAKGEANKQWESIKAAAERAGEDPAALVKASGLTVQEFYKRLTQQILNEGKVPPEQEALDLAKKNAAEIDRLRKEKTEAEEAKAKIEREAKVKLAEAQYTGYLKNLVKDNDKFEMVALHGDEGLGLVLEVIKTHHGKTGEVLTDEDAIGMVESYYREDAKKIAQAKYLRTLISAKEPSAETPAQKPPPGLKTLTNNVAATPPTREKRPLSDDERLEALIAKLG